MKTWRSGSNGWTAKLAALLFVLQVLLVGVTANAADGMPHDQFGNVICSSTSMQDAQGKSDGSGHQPGKLDCCTLGCPMFGVAIVPPPTVVSFLVRQPLVRIVPFVFYEDVGTGAVETPRQTRGPPAST